MCITSFFLYRKRQCLKKQVKTGSQWGFCDNKGVRLEKEREKKL